MQVSIRRLDGTAAEHDVAVVADGGLPGRCGALRRVEHDAYGVASGRDDGRPLLRLAVAELDPAAEFVLRHVARNPIARADGDLSAVQLRFRAQNDPVPNRVDFADIARFRERETELSVLADRIVDDAPVPADVVEALKASPAVIRVRVIK